MERAGGGERGIALVIALIMMFLMGLLGAIIFSASTSEMQITRNYRVKKDALYAAERAVEYSKSDGNIMATIGTGIVAVPLGGVDLSAGNSDASGFVEFMSSGNPPRGSGVDITSFQARYYVIDATGTGPSNSQVEVEANYARILPKE